MKKTHLRVHFDQHNSTIFRNSNEPCIESVTLLNNQILEVTFLKRLSIRNVILLKIFDGIKTVEKFLKEEEVNSKYLFKHNLPLDLYQMLYKTTANGNGKNNALLIEFIVKPSDVAALGKLSDYRRMSGTQKVKHLASTTSTKQIFIDLSKCGIEEGFSYGISIECFDFELQLQYVSEINQFIIYNSKAEDDSKYELINNANNKPSAGSEQSDLSYWKIGVSVKSKNIPSIT